MSNRRTPKEPAPALAGTLDRIRRGRAGNEALEGLFGTNTDPASPEPAPPAAQEPSEPPPSEPPPPGPAAGPETTSPPAASTDASPGPAEGSRPGTPEAAAARDLGAAAPPAARSPQPQSTPRDDAQAPAPAPGEATTVSAPEHQRATATPATTTGRRTRTGTRPAGRGTTADTTAEATSRRRRPSGVPFTVLLDRRLRAKVNTWMLQNRRHRQRPSNSSLLVAAADRWAPDRAEEFLDWFDQYEPIGMATPDASRFSARIHPELVEALEVVCAELTVEHDLRIPRQALMMFLLDEELDVQLAALQP